MTQIKEAYVSFDVAKLLKEKGFDEETRGYYPIKGDATGRLMFGSEYPHNDSQVQISAPTQQMVMRWLRDVHSLHIEILAAYHFRTFDGYSFEIYDISKGEFINYQSDKGLFKTAEDATENAIKYCLTNLI